MDSSYFDGASELARLTGSIDEALDGLCARNPVRFATPAGE